MDTLSIELLEKIFEKCPWEERLICLRSVNTHWNNIVHFRDTTRIKLSELEQISMQFQSDRNGNTDRTKWLCNCVNGCFIIFGDYLKTVVFDSSVNIPIDPSTFLLFLQMCPYLEKLSFRTCHLKSDAYEHLTMVRSSLRVLIMHYVENGSRLSPVLRELHLDKLKLTGNRISGLNTADNSTLRSLRLDDELAPILYTPGYLEQLVNRFPNLTSHRCACISQISTFNDHADLLSSIDTFYTRLSDLKRSDVFSAWIKLDLSLQQILLRMERNFSKLTYLKLELDSEQIPNFILSGYLKLRSLILHCSGSLPMIDLGSILETPTIRRLEIKDGYLKIAADWNGPIVCQNLRILKLRYIRFSSLSILSDVMESCPRLIVFNIKLAVSSPDLSDFGIPEKLVKYANRSGSHCRLRNISVDSISIEHLVKILNSCASLHHFKVCTIKIDTSTSLDRLNETHLKSFHFRIVQPDDPDISEEFIVKILNISKNLKDVSFPLDVLYDGEMVFREIGEHRSLRRVRLNTNGTVTFPKTMVNWLKEGRRVLIQNGYHPTVLILKTCLQSVNCTERLNKELKTEKIVFS